MTTPDVRIGSLGAAKILPFALVRPARKVAGAEFTAIAARNPERARKFARRHGIPKVHDSYEALIADEQLEAVYIPLPNGLHGYWSKQAIGAGKHVLCEKPFTANADEAADVAQAGEAAGLVVAEAFHWRYHPLAARMLEIVGSGELGEVRHIEAQMCFPLPRKSNIRWRLDLAGGAMMDAGCYAVSIVRTLAGAEPEVKSARADLRSAGVDRTMAAELSFADGRTARTWVSMLSARIVRFSAKVVGEKATLHVTNPMSPQYFHLLSVKGPRTRRHERVKGAATYTHQLEAFVAAVRGGPPMLTPASDAVANMRVIDDIYRAAGLEPRRPTIA